MLTLGCPKNTVASKRLMRALLGAGFEIADRPEDASAVIVNTCGFIESAAMESIDRLLELSAVRKNGDQKIIAIGCLPERYKGDLAEALPELDGCLGLNELDRLPSLLGGEAKLDIAGQVQDDLPYSYLEITRGCDRRCSFCTIPSIHGPLRSVPRPDVIAEALGAVGQGAKELVLIGQETGSYGRDLVTGGDISDLLASLAGVCGKTWLRLFYLQWDRLDDRLINTLTSYEQICDYLDIPIQHSSREILSSMNRSGGADLYLAVISKLRKNLPDLALRTSIIVGFPGETDSRFLELAEFLKEAEFDYVGVFEFSPEEGTPAASLPDVVDPEERRDRAAKIRLLADDISGRRRRRWLGRTVDVLIEEVKTDTANPDRARYFGRTRWQGPEIDGGVYFTGGDYTVGDVAKVEIEDTGDYDLTGTSDG